MEAIIVLFLGFIFFKYIVKVVRSFLSFCLNIVAVLMLKLILDVPLNAIVLFIFCFKYMYRYIAKKINLSIQRYRKYRKDSDCLKLRKFVRLLFECNYIVFIINCCVYLLHIILNQSLWYSIEITIKLYIVLLIVSAVKKVIDHASARYYA